MEQTYVPFSQECFLSNVARGIESHATFLLGMNSALPVFRGEIQCRMLGMAVESYNPQGIVNPPGIEGELVCVKPFPCMPLGFWPLPGFGTEEAVKAAQLRFQDAYFSGSNGVWCELHLQIFGICM